MQIHKVTMMPQYRQKANYKYQNVFEILLNGRVVKQLTIKNIWKYAHMNISKKGQSFYSEGSFIVYRE